MWDVVYLPEAESERLVLPKVERNALIHAVEKLEAFGPQLGYPTYQRGAGVYRAAGAAPACAPQPVARPVSAGERRVRARRRRARGAERSTRIRSSSSPGSCPTRGDRGGGLDDAETVGFANRSPCPRRGPARS